MKIKAKILWTLLGMSLLVALVGALAANRLRASAMAGVTREAQDVAHLVSFILMSGSKLSPSAQEIVAKLHQKQGRDTPLYNELMRLTRTTIHHVLLAGLGSVAIALLIALLVGRSIVRPLRQLTNVATGFSYGRTDLPPPPPRNDEIGELATAFNDMMQKRRRAEDELLRLRDELEVRVAKRTSELAEANEALRTENADRKRAEETSRESEEKFRQLADNITDVFWVTSPDLKAIHYISPGYELVWGRSTESLYSHPHQWLEAILPEERERVFGVFAGLMGSEAEASVEYQIARPDGIVRWVHDRGFQVRDAAGNLVRLAGIATDITERKQTEEALQRQKTELRVLFDLMPAMIFFKHGKRHSAGQQTICGNRWEVCRRDRRKTLPRD